jgi:hypothetical protein
MVCKAYYILREERALLKYTQDTIMKTCDDKMAILASPLPETMMTTLTMIEEITM